MALANTTLAAACAASDKKITVAAATGFAAGNVIRVDDETMKVGKGYVAASTTVPVWRGWDGTVAVAHANGAQVTDGTPTEYAQAGTPQTVDAFPIAGRARVINSYSADGAIALPPAGGDAIAVISGTAHTGMTLAVPSKDLNGSKLTILNLTAAAHVITVAGGIGGSAIVTLTQDASGRSMIELLAYNELWYCPALAGTTTGFDVAVS
jgi:hypothetical protein